MKTLIIPGIGDSNADHWQSLWQASDPEFIRVQQHDWEYPVCSEWLDALDTTIANENVILIAHSLGCLLVAHRAAQADHNIKGALLVAPPSPTAPAAAALFDSQITGFLPVPMHTFDFPCIVVASSNDPYSDQDFSKACARA